MDVHLGETRHRRVREVKAVVRWPCCDGKIRWRANITNMKTYVNSKIVPKEKKFKSSFFAYFLDTNFTPVHPLNSLKVDKSTSCSFSLFQIVFICTFFCVLLNFYCSSFSISYLQMRLCLSSVSISFNSFRLRQLP